MPSRPADFDRAGNESADEYVSRVFRACGSEHRATDVMAVSLFAWALFGMSCAGVLLICGAVKLMRVLL